MSIRWRNRRGRLIPRGSTRRRGNRSSRLGSCCSRLRRTILSGYEILKLLSNVTSASGDYAAAQKSVEVAIAWREQVNGADDPKLAEELIELSTLCERQKNYPRALDLLQLALKMHVRVNGAVSTQVADDFSRMALVYMDAEAAGAGDAGARKRDRHSREGAGRGASGDSAGARPAGRNLDRAA